MPRIGVYTTNGGKLLELDSAELANSVAGAEGDLDYTQINYGDEKFEIYGPVLVVVKSKREEE